MGAHSPAEKGDLQSVVTAFDTLICEAVTMNQNTARGIDARSLSRDDLSGRR